MKMEKDDETGEVMQSRSANEIFEELSTLSSVEKYIDPDTYVETGFSISVTSMEQKNYLENINLVG